MKENICGKPFEKYLSDAFLNKEDIDYQEVSKPLPQIRIQNLNNVIIAHLSANWFAPKLDTIKTIITGYSDFLKMVVKVLKKTCKKAKPKEIVYRSYKHLTVMHSMRNWLENLNTVTVIMCLNV